MKLRHPLSSRLMCVAFATGCGFSQSINSSVQEQERQFEVEASRQMLQQTDLLIAAVMAKATLVEPQTTARCEPIPMTKCTICYVSSSSEQSLSLKTPSCAIDTPAQAQQFNLELSLRDLSLAATQISATEVVLRGQGHLDLSAQVPIIGLYRGVAAYTVRSGSVNTMNGAFQVELLMTYQSGEADPIELTVKATGSPQGIQGQIAGPKMTCDVKGSLRAPTVTCQ